MAFAALGAAQQAVFDLHFSGLGINIPNLERAQLRGAQTGIEQGHDQRLIALCGGVTHRKLAPIWIVHFLSGFTCFKEHFDFSFGDRLDGWLLEFERRDGFDGTGKVELATGPGEESAQAYLEVVDRFRGQRLSVTLIQREVQSVRNQTR